MVNDVAHIADYVVKNIVGNPKGLTSWNVCNVPVCAMSLALLGYDLFVFGDGSVDCDRVSNYPDNVLTDYHPIDSIHSKIDAVFTGWFLHYVSSGCGYVSIIDD